MMNILRFLILILICSSPIIAQNPYYDALSMKSQTEGYLDPKTNKYVFAIDSNNIRVIESILRRYGLAGTYDNDKALFGAIKAVFDDSSNPFILVSAVGQNTFDDQKISGTTVPQQLLGSVGGIDVTNIARGISLFMIDRAKKELNAAFFNRLKNQFEKNPEIQILFPKTSSSLEQLLSYHYSEMLPALRTNFFEDLKKISTRLDDLLELPRYQVLLEDFPEIRIAIRSIQLVHNLENEKIHPADLIEQFANYPEWSEKKRVFAYQNFGNSIKFASILSNSLRYVNPNKENDSIKDRAWINSKELLELFKDKDEITFKIYMGLIYQKVTEEEIIFLKKSGEEIILDSIIRNNTITLFKYQNYLKEFIVNAEKVDEKIKVIREIKSKNEKPSKEDLYQYIDNSIEIIESGLNVAKLFKQDMKTKEFIVLARNGNDLYKNIFNENYTAGISNLVTVIENLIIVLNKDYNKDIEFISLDTTSNYNPNNLKNKFEAFNKASTKKQKKKQKNEFLNALNDDIKKISSELKSDSDNEKLIETLSLYEGMESFFSKEKQIDTLRSVLNYIRKYGLFAANLVEAKNEKEVQGVIESAALPVGSSALKKHSCINISVQSFLGVGYTGYFKKDSESLDRSWDNNVVVFAPIGVSVDFGFGNGGSLGLFVSLLDVGAIVDYELKSDTTFAVIDNNVDTTRSVSVNNSQNYKVELGQIISPGFFVTYGFPFNTPMAINVGAQYGPGLIEIKDDNTVLGKPNWRFIASLTIDIPWFTLYNVDNLKYRKNSKNGKK